MCTSEQGGGDVCMGEVADKRTCAQSGEASTSLPGGSNELRVGKGEGEHVRGGRGLGP